MAVITFPEGTTFRVQFTIKDKTTKLAIDLTGSTLEFAVFNHSDSYTGNVIPVLTYTIGSGITLTDPTNGVCVVTFPPDDTVDLSVNNTATYDWELNFNELDGDV